MTSITLSASINEIFVSILQVKKREYQTTEFTYVDPKEYGIEIEEEEFKFGKYFFLNLEEKLKCTGSAYHIKTMG